MAGVAQFGIICLNAIIVKYAAFTVARCAISYVTPWQSEMKAQQANYLVKKMITYTNNYGPKNTLSKLLAEEVDEKVTDSTLSIEDYNGKKGYKYSKFKYKHITLEYDLKLTVPFVNAFYGITFGEKRSDGYYYKLKADAIMHSGVEK